VRWYHNLYSLAYGWIGALRRLKFADDTHGLYEAIDSGWNHGGVIDATNRVFL
jgi:hypothetical protein